MSKSGACWRMLIPSATMFFWGGCIATLELVASRLAARHLGSSLYTWTAVLGIALAGLALGNYWGGRIADRYHVRRTLAVLFGLSSAATVGIIVLNHVLGNCSWLWQLSWPSHVFLHIALVFLVPSTLLGMIGPVAARMVLDQGLEAGRTMGSLYAWAAAGGIAGTFLTGFFLLVAFGSTTIIWLLSAAMLIVAVLYWISCWAMYLWAMAFGALATMGMAPDPWAQEAGSAVLLRTRADPNVLYEAQTPYRHIVVRRLSSRPEKRVLLQDGLFRREIVVNDATSLQHFHLRVYADLTHGLGEDKNNLSMMVLGAGGYAFPRYLRASRPDSLVEVVETDPGVTKAAVEALGLAGADAGKIIHMDARAYVDHRIASERKGKTLPKYDFIYEDALDASALPFPLLTKEFNDRIARLLAEDGIYLIHLLDVCETGSLLGAVVGTIQETFPHVYVIAPPIDPAAERESFVVIATRRRFDPQAVLKEQNRHLGFRILDETQLRQRKEQCGNILLTDDYAPVENLQTAVAKRGTREVLAHKRFDEAAQRQSGNQYERSILKYQQALELYPALAVESYRQIGLMYMARNQPDNAVEAFHKALAAPVRAVGSQMAVASVHMYLGILLGRLGRPQEAKEQLARAAESFRVELEQSPNAAVAWEWLGDTSAALRDFQGASVAFERAMILEPGNPSHYESLARTLETQGRYDEAIAAVRKHTRLMQERGRRDLVAQLKQYIELLEYRRAKQPKP